MVGAARAGHATGRAATCAAGRAAAHRPAQPGAVLPRTRRRRARSAAARTLPLAGDRRVRVRTRVVGVGRRSEEHTSELQSLMRISYAVFCLKKKTTNQQKEINQRLQKHTKMLKEHIQKES